MTNKVVSFLLLFLWMQKSNTYSQLKISGPECIVPGTEYQYDFFVHKGKNLQVSICVEGGFLVANNSTCITGKDLDYVRVVWNDDITRGKLTITAASDNGVFRVRQTKALQGGEIDSSSKVQLVQPIAIPEKIICTAARGGNCSPSFDYQWEQSEDNLHWAKMDGAVSRNLIFSTVLPRTLFFRRKIVEIASNTIAYSDVAVVVVNTISITN